MTTHDVIKRVRELLADRTHWTQGKLARRKNSCGTDAGDPEAVRWCVIGALRKIAGSYESPARIQLEQQLYLYAGTYELGTFNDTHKHADVLKFLDYAIEQLESYGPPLQKVQTNG